MLHRYLVASTFDSLTTGRYIEIHRTCTGTQGTLYVIVRECPILWLVACGCGVVDAHSPQVL